jgi:hypothetical protein
MNTDSMDGENMWAWCPHRAAGEENIATRHGGTPCPAIHEFIQASCSSVVLPFCSLQVPMRLRISWTNNLPTASGGNVPGGKLDILYLEARTRRA